MQQQYTFKGSRTLEQRKGEADFNRNLYPNQVLIIIEQSAKSKLPKQKFFKFKFPDHLRLINLLAVLKQHLNLSKYDTINLYCNTTLLQVDSLLKTLYEQYKDVDGFLYINYIEMNSFGIV